MFYSHEVLTSRKYGVATVWLVATLGSKSSSKKINRKAIQDVDVPKACQTIIDPAAPMALRLQGNLLYGVSRVYDQQCSYVLSDAQNTYNSMHLVFRTFENAALDAHARKVRPEQLVLPDDPSFLPEFVMPPPELLADLDIGPALPTLRVSGESQSMTPFSNDRRNDFTPAPDAGLILPTSSSVGPGSFALPDNGPSSIAGPVGFEDDFLIDAPDFTFDENGEFVDLTEAVHATPTARGGSNMHKDVGKGSQVIQGPEGAVDGDIEFGSQMDLDLPLLGSDLPDGDAFPTNPQDDTQNSQDIHNQPSEVLESSSNVVASLRGRPRGPRVLPIDTVQELRNRDIADWNVNYLANMRAASKAKAQYRNAKLAKKNAEHWMWGGGIGGIAARARGLSVSTPFERFIGDELFKFYTGIDRKGGALKRDRDSGIDEATQGEARRVRRRADDYEEEVGRGQEHDEMLVAEEEDVEMAREEQERLSDMPWNITASIRGSSAVPMSGRAGVIGSAPPSSLASRARLVSESPLHRRSQPGALDILQHLGEDDDDPFAGIGTDDDFAGFAGPGFSSDMPDVVLPLAPPNVRVREALSTEGGNFLAFVADAIEEKRGGVQQGEQFGTNADAEDVDMAEVSFEELLPPHDMNRVVAAQAFMMTLALGTKGLLEVRQEDHFDEIKMSITEKGRATHEAVPTKVEYGEHDLGHQGGRGGNEQVEEQVVLDEGVEAESIEDDDEEDDDSVHDH